MSLKELISSLIAPLSARPKSQFYQTITPVSGETASYTMPVDGWVRLYGANPEGSNQIVQLWGGENQATLSTSTTVQSPATWSSSAIGFYRKGDLIFYSISGFSEMKLNIFALVGGGYLSYFATFGGGLWLRLNHSFKRFSSSLVAKQCRVVRTLILRSPRLVNGANNLLLHLTDTLNPTFSTQKSANFQTLQQLFEQNPKLNFPQRFIFLCIKAINLQHILTTRIRQELISRSSRQSAQANLAIQGGAL